MADADLLLQDACINSLRCEIQSCGESNYRHPFERGERRIAAMMVSYIKQGNCTIQAEGQRYSCKQGSLVILPEFRNHLLRTEKAGNHIEQWLNLRLRIFGTVDISQLLDVPPLIPKNSARTLVPICQQLIASYPAQGVSAVLEQQALLRQFLQHYVALSPMLLTNTRMQALMRVMPALEYIQQNYHEDIDRHVLAKRAHLATSRFHELFKQALHVTPILYRNRLRFQEARRLLESTKDPIQVVAEQVGFEDAFHFSRMFKQVYGMSPRAYRQNK